MKMRLLLLVLFAGAFALAGWFSCRAFGPRGGSSRAERPQAVPSVAVATAESLAFNPPKEYVAHVEPVQEVDILPQVDGYIKRVAFAEGGFVKAGDLLFEIDPEQYAASLELRHSEVASAQSRVNVAAAEVERATRYFSRVSGADDRGITAVERDTAETTLASVKAELAAAKAQVTQAKAALAIAEFNYKHVKVIAPISGRIGRAQHHVGDYVSPSKSPLARIVQFDPIRVAFPMTDRDYDAWQAAAEKDGTALGAGRRLRVRLADGSFHAVPGKLDFADNQISRETATIMMRAIFANARGRLVPGAFLKIVADAEKPASVTAVPISAVVRRHDGCHVWTIEEGAGKGGEGKGDVIARRREIVAGEEWNGLYEIRSGLNPGEHVIVQGVHKVADGRPVRVVPKIEVD